MAGRRKNEYRIEFTDLTDNKANTTYSLPDITESANILHNGKEITIDKNMLTDLRILGRGHFADNVMLSEVQGHPDLQMAVKRLPLNPSDNNPGEFTTKTDLRTIRMVGSGENPHVTKFYAGLRDRGNSQLIICMEACDASMDRFSAKMHSMEQTKHLDILLKRMIHQITDALRFLKSKKILHRDVKPSNILINQNPVLFKLCDFGICGEMIDSVSHTMMKGTQIYLAPERIDGNQAPQGYGVRSDMWALGLSTLEIALNQHPFFGLEGIGIIEKLKTWKPEPPSSLSSELQQLIIRLLELNHENRPETYNDILASPAIQALPAAVTDEEIQIVTDVIQNLPVIHD